MGFVCNVEGNIYRFPFDPTSFGLVYVELQKPLSSVDNPPQLSIAHEVHRGGL